jgi:hypothetical protein
MTPNEAYDVLMRGRKETDEEITAKKTSSLMMRANFGKPVSSSSRKQLKHDALS